MATLVFHSDLRKRSEPKAYLTSLSRRNDVGPDPSGRRKRFDLGLSLVKNLTGLTLPTDHNKPVGSVVP
jgi:hypothetical protein